MKTFLQQVADTIIQDYPQWDNLTVVFPNRRAALYFKKALAESLDAPRWSPDVVSIEEFIGSQATLMEADKLSLIFRLYRVFKEVTGSSENLDQFYFWGEMLLRDFDELDKYMVNAEGLFKDLSNQKELDDYFDYLTDEQKQFLKDFWQTVEFTTSESKARFLELWRNLYKIYSAFRTSLRHDNIGYSGMIHRSVAENFENNTVSVDKSKNVIFAGFNALTTAEEKIITFFVQHNQSRIFWDEDEFYVNTNHREAGTFFRLYRQHPVLGKTFPEKPQSLLSNAKRISILGVPQKAGQPKLLAQQLEGLIRQSINQETLSERTVIVLPDENLLLPVLYALPQSLESINITMGFSLVNTPFYSLIDFLFDLHLHKKKDEFYYRHVLSILNHPYIKNRIGDFGSELKATIVDKNQVHVSSEFFTLENEDNAMATRILALIFKPVEHPNFLQYLLGIVQELASPSQTTGLKEQEFAFYFHRTISRVQELSETEPMELRMQQRMFRQILRSEKVPFSGEPLKGLQIMGVLETRNLDFDHVIVLSLNEGMWPAAPRQGSYIPHNIRKAYGLPTSEHQDAMYAYLFYRLLQRTSQADLYYNTEPDVLGTGEMSRYLYQLIYEANWPHERKILYNPVQVHQPQPVTIQKRTEVLEKLERYLGKALTPSTLNTYMECRMKFYFRHLVEIKEPEEVEEEADARIFGNIFHKVMELFYIDIKPPAGDWHVREEHFNNLDVKLERQIERAFRSHFHLADDKKFEYEGRQLVVKEMVKKFAYKVLAQDKAYAPFTIEFLEANNFNTKLKVAQRGKKIDVVLGGKIDRVDSKVINGKATVRIIDYKTGKDENKFEDVPSLFARNPKRNKAAFQAMLYSWVYKQRPQGEDVTLKPGLINRKEIFRDDFAYGLTTGNRKLNDVSSMMPEFEQQLNLLLEEMFNPETAFDQTSELKNCMYCSYKEICGR